MPATMVPWPNARRKCPRIKYCSSGLMQDRRSGLVHHHDIGRMQDGSRRLVQHRRGISWQLSEFRGRPRPIVYKVIARD